jgi:hypothetical protein
VRRYVVALAVAVVLVAVVRSLVVQSFVVPTGSMSPTVRPGDRVVVSRWSHVFGEVRRGDVVVFDGAGVFGPAAARSSSPLAQAGRGAAALLGVPVGDQDYVKRVVGPAGRAGGLLRRGRADHREREAAGGALPRRIGAGQRDAVRRRRPARAAVGDGGRPGGLGRLPESPGRPGWGVPFPWSVSSAAWWESTGRSAVPAA